MKRHFKNGLTQDIASGTSIDVQNMTWYVSCGFVAVYVGFGAERRLVFVYKPGEIFPLPYQRSVLPSGRKLLYEAFVDTSLLGVDAQIFAQRIMSSPDGPRKLLKESIEFNDYLTDRVVDLGQLDTHSRLVSRLLYLANRFGVRKDEDTVIAIPLTYMDIARSIGTTRETVNRLMSKFQKAHILSVDRRIVKIHCLKSLRAELSSTTRIF